MKHVLAKTVEVDPRGQLIIDGVVLPWYLAQEWAVEDLGGTFALHVGILADRVVVTTPYHSVDTQMDAVRAEAVSIVREGLKDVLEWLGEEP